jgi:hypothetical protein
MDGLPHKKEVQSKLLSQKLRCFYYYYYFDSNNAQMKRTHAHVEGAEHQNSDGFLALPDWKILSYQCPAPKTI